MGRDDAAEPEARDSDQISALLAQERLRRCDMLHHHMTANEIERLVRNLPREQDRKAFEGWDAKQPAPPSIAVSSPSPAPQAAEGGKV